MNRNAPQLLKSIIYLMFMSLMLPILIYAVYQIATLYIKASGTPANIIVDSQNIIAPLDIDFYHAFSQGGEEKTNMLKPVSSSLKGLNPKIIRLDHIYDYYNVVAKVNGQITFNFSGLDDAVNTIIETGATPLLSLSYMPADIAIDGNIINPPQNWNDWSYVVRKTIEHYSGIYNKNLKGVYYEVWNEPDLAQFGSWKTYGDKNYLTLYNHAVNGANSTKNVNPFYIGGPSTTGLYENWIMALITNAKRIDFFSWHSYISDPKEFYTDQENIKKWLISFPQYAMLPQLITEFGPTGNKSSIYSTYYIATYTAAVVRQLIIGGPKYIFNFQIKDGPNQNNDTGWGIMAHETSGAYKKPRYYIYNFLDQMQGSLLATRGDGSWVTSYSTVDNNSIKVMLINFDQRGSHSESVPVSIINLDPGKYSWRVKYLFQSGCSINNPPINSPAININLNDRQFSTQICLSPLNVAILELTK